MASGITNRRILHRRTLSWNGRNDGMARKGKRSITKPVADKLEVIPGIPSIEWVSLQTRFDYDTQKNEERQIAEQVCSPILTHVP